MIKLEPNMYVRTKSGIAKIIGRKLEPDDYYFQCWITDRFLCICDDTEYLCDSDILKASNNIIDLIEVGDYVNGMQVIEVREHLHNDIEIVLTNGEFKWSFSKNESDYKIKSIVTKEQFSSMEYRLGE